ncbi:MFS transporter [Actinomadura sp. NPDC047616]|uniref:MFS transporter n=1 Tax=Actinomadura sp. NPDC047616 TaxID=3155914 RepID=UPI003403E416
MDPSAATASGPKAGRREWIGLIVLALPTLLLSLDFSVIYLAIPHLSTDLGADSTQQLWIADIYGFMVAGFLITMGTLGDRIGRRRLLLIGAALFGVASVVAAFSTSAEMLIATRAIMGITGATLMPSTLALISNMFKDPKESGMAIAAWMSCFMGGMALGPVVGGTMLDNFWWGSVFLLGVPVMVLLVVVGPILLPEYRDPDAGRLDMVSVLLSLLAILPIVYGLKELAKDGWAAVPVVTILVGVAFVPVFVIRQRGLASPLVDMSLFRNRTFSAALFVGLLVPMLQGGTYFLIAQHLQSVEGLEPIKAGLWLVPSTLIMIFAIGTGTALAARVRPGYVFTAGLLIGTVGYAVLSQVDGPDQLVKLWIGYAIMALGVGLPSGLGTALILGAAPPEKAGSASSISEASGELGMALGVAMLGSLATFVYRSELSGNVPGAVPPHSADIAEDNIAAAVSVAEGLPQPLGGQFLGTVRDAFADGLGTVAIVAGVIFAALAVFSAVMFRHIPPTGSQEGGDEAAAEDAGVGSDAAAGPR